MGGTGGGLRPLSGPHDRAQPGGIVALLVGIQRDVPATTFDNPGVADYARALFGAAFLAGVNPDLYETVLFAPYTMIGSGGGHFAVLSVTSCMSCGQIQQPFGRRVYFPLTGPGA